MSRTTRTHHARRQPIRPADRAARHRVNQETVDKMAELRRQGLTFGEIGERLGCSERTARRYVGTVKPHIQLPQANLELVAEDPGELRDRLARWFSNSLYEAPDYPRPRESVTFMAEAMRLLRERLAETDPLMLELMVKDIALRKRLLVEVVGRLYSDFRSLVQFESGFGHLGISEAAAQWRPLRERPLVHALEDEEFFEPEV